MGRRFLVVLVASASTSLGLAALAAPAIADGEPAMLAFTVQPGGATAGQPFATQPQVTIEDAGGNPVTADTSTVTLSLGAGAGALTGCSANTVEGVASFSGCAITDAGTADQLTANDTDDSVALTGTSSTLFAVAIAQGAPTSNQTTPAASAAFTDQLAVTGNEGAVTYTQSTGGADLTVSGTGAVSTTGMLAAGSYTATGSTVDSDGDTGTFSYGLTVTPVTITQASPTSGSTTPAGSATFSDQLAADGGVGPVAYDKTGGSGDLDISASGKLTTTGILAVNSYAATGTTSDSYGDTGTFTYTLTVGTAPITQVAPTAGSTTTAASSTFSDQLAVTGNEGAVTYTQTSGSGHLTVSSSGQVRTTGTLDAGDYTATGSTSDADGDNGTFSYGLTVTPVTITQASPTSGSTATTASSSFTAQLAVSGNSGPVSYAQTAGSADLTVSATGALATTGTLDAGSYTATGTMLDAQGDSGTFSYTLTVSAVTISQSAPTSGSCTTTASSGFTAALVVSGNSGAATYAKTGGSPNLTVSATGEVATTGTLPAGGYTVTGTTSDSEGDSGTFTYTLTVSAVTISQGAPTSGSTTTTGSSTFSAQLAVGGSNGTVSYTKTGGSANVAVSASGKLTTSGILSVGNYTASGTTADPDGDTGTFSYTLTVTPATITQLSPTSAVVTIAGSYPYANQLNVSGNNGLVTFSQTQGKYVVVTSSGAVSTDQLLPAATYTASGTLSDPYGDTGTFIFQLTVGHDAITQGSPTSGSTTVGASAAFSAQLSVSGNHGVPAYTQTSGGTNLIVSESGAVTTSGTLAAGSYTATGSVTDPDADGGTFTYTLTVGPGTIAQGPPTSGETTTTGSSSFSTLLAATGNYGTVTYTQTGAKTALAVSTSGAVAAPGTLAAGTYTAGGTTGDPYGDTGTFGYTLTVTATTISQVAPTAGSISIAASAAFNVQLATSGANGTVTYVKTGGSPDVPVSSSGLLATTGTLADGIYTATGTTADRYGDKGTFSYTLTVSAPSPPSPAPSAPSVPPATPTAGPVGLAQVAPFSGQTSTGAAARFSVQLAVNRSSGTVTYTESAGKPNLVVSTTGRLTTAGPLSAGVYTATGTTSDISGDVGTFSYTLTVKAAVALVQGGPISATAMVGAGVHEQLAVTNGDGAVTFAENASTSSHLVVVSATGTVTAPPTLLPGTYRVTGSDRDSSGDTGAWTFTLVVRKATTATLLELSRAKLTYGAERAEHISVAVSSAYRGAASKATAALKTGTVAVEQARRTLCTIKLASGKGTCTLTANDLGPGTYDLVAAFPGNAYLAPSRSAGKPLTVIK